MTSIILVASSEPRAGRSLIAAAIAYRLGRDGGAVTLARLSGDAAAASATADAVAFAGLEGVRSPDTAVDAPAAKQLPGDVIVLEAPAGPVGALASALSARVLGVGRAAAAAVDAGSHVLLGSIITRATVSDAALARQRADVLAVLPEDRVLAAPSVADIAAALSARRLAGEDDGAIERVMIGTIASDAATPYFVNRERTCVVTRFDKTDIQLAALNTDLQCLVLTGGGEPSPYLLDRVGGHRPDVAVLLTDGDTVASMRAIEPLYGESRFAGEAKLQRAVELLDEAGLALQL